MRSEWVGNWQHNNGGRYNAEACALKMLEEAVELCIASGVAQTQMNDIVWDEVTKASKKGLYLRPNLENIKEELADVAICLEVIAQGIGTSLEEEVDKKILILEQRNWKPDSNGVLRRDRE